MKGRSIPRFVRDLRTSLEDEFRLSNRISISAGIKGQVIKDEQVVLNFIEQTNIPHWFRGLSEFQLEAASDLCNALRDDILQSTTHRIRSILVRLGLRPQINSIQVTFLKELSRGNDLAFLWFLMEIHYKNRTKFISVNEQIIMSSIAHLDMVTTLRELDRILPPPQLTKEELRKIQREKEAIEEQKRLREEAKKPKIEYVLPYFEPLKRPVIYGNEITIKMPDHRVNFGPYEVYKDPHYIVQNENNRWYTNYKLRPAKRIADWILKNQINNMFDPDTDTMLDYDSKQEIICQHHEIAKNLEISLKNELALIAKQRMLDYLNVKKIRSERACKRIQEQINADVQMYMKQWRQYTKKKSGLKVSVHKFDEHCYHHIRQRVSSDEVLPICEPCVYESSDELVEMLEAAVEEPVEKPIEKEKADKKCMGDHFVVLLDNTQSYQQCCDSEMHVGDGNESSRNTIKIETRCCGGKDKKCKIQNNKTSHNKVQIDDGESVKKTHSRLCGGCDEIHLCQVKLDNNKFTAFGSVRLPTGRCCCGAPRHRLPLAFVPAPGITPSTTSESSAVDTPAKRALIAEKIIKRKQRALKYPKLMKEVQPDRCADVYMHRYDFGHDDDSKLIPSDTCFEAPRENLPHNFDYFRVFREKPDPETINVKQAFVDALDSEIGLLTKGDKNARPKLAEAITACAEKLWQKQLEIKNAELERLAKEEAEKDIHYNLEYYDPENRELMQSMLKDALEVMSKNPKYVLASLPESYKLPLLQEFILHRYGKVYTYKERMRSYTLSKKIFKALDKLTLLVPHPKVKHIYKEMRVDYDCHDYVLEKVKRMKQIFYNKLDDTIMEQARIFWFAMQPYLCTSSPRNTYFAFMPATATHIHHFRLWQPNEYIAAKESWFKRQMAKANKPF